MAASDAFYLEILAEVNPLFDELGTTYTVRAEATYNPVTRKSVEGATRQVVGLLADSQTLNNLGSQIFPVGELSQNWIGKKNLLLTAAADPKAGEEIQVDGKWFPLSRIKDIKPADIVLVYVLDVSQ